MPVPVPQSHLDHPLTALLGSAGNVRVLRELVQHGGALGTAVLAQRSGLSIQQVRLVLDGLQRQGVVDVLGGGHARLFRARREHPLHAALETLFMAETKAFHAAWDRICDAAAAVPARAVWLYGSTARGDDTPTSDIDLLVISDTPSDAADHLRERLAPLEESFGRSVAVVGLDLADVARLATENDPWWASLIQDARPLAGYTPEQMRDRALAATLPA
jgi:predicted nucleotidyltransferase